MNGEESLDIKSFESENEYTDYEVKEESSSGLRCLNEESHTGENGNTSPRGNNTMTKFMIVDCRSKSGSRYKTGEVRKRKTVGSKHVRSRDIQLTVMLLLVSFTFLLLTLPQYAR